ncbi:hypothetical protein ACIPC2_12165 [Curtobacterium pusillum]|uniref:hypothetical protein n=1 Tax=Curtobacterium pusillum TaxID=69373 RepID=UPI0037FC07CA
MTDTAAAAEWRWTQAAEQARLVLATAPPRWVSLPRLAGVLVVTLVLLVGIALAFGPDSTVRWAVAIGGSVAGLGVVVVETIRTVRARTRHPEWEPVTKLLSGRERYAVERVVRGRAVAPDDRLDVVRATARQTAAGRAVVAVVGQLVLFTSIAVSGIGFWMIYVAVAIAWLVAVVFAFRSVIVARRYVAAR